MKCSELKFKNKKELNDTDDKQIICSALKIPCKEKAAYSFI